MRWALFLLVAAALWGAVPAATALADSPGTRTSEVSADAPGRVAFVGVPGLHWDDVDPERTPNLWRLAGQSDLGSLSVTTLGTVACPFDGWMTVSAGIRSASARPAACRPPPRNGARGRGIPGFAELLAKRDGGYVGTLGDRRARRGPVHRGGRQRRRAGAGRPRRRGGPLRRVPRRSLPTGALPVLAVDVDDLIPPTWPTASWPRTRSAVPADARRAALRAADAEVGALLAELPADTTVMLAGLADHGSVPHLRVAMWRGPGRRAPARRPLHPARRHRRSSRHHRHRADRGGHRDPATRRGPAAGRRGSRPPLERRGRLRRADADGQTIREQSGLFFTGFAVLQVALLPDRLLCCAAAGPPGSAWRRSARLAARLHLPGQPAALGRTGPAGAALIGGWSPSPLAITGLAWRVRGGAARSARPRSWRGSPRRCSPATC